MYADKVLSTTTWRGSSLFDVVTDLKVDKVYCLLKCFLTLLLRDTCPTIQLCACVFMWPQLLSIKSCFPAVKAEKVQEAEGEMEKGKKQENRARTIKRGQCKVRGKIDEK